MYVILIQYSFSFFSFSLYFFSILFPLIFSFHPNKNVLERGGRKKIRKKKVKKLMKEKNKKGWLGV